MQPIGQRRDTHMFTAMFGGKFDLIKDNKGNVFIGTTLLAYSKTIKKIGTERILVTC
jgi:hypothetical protein